MYTRILVGVIFLTTALSGYTSDPKQDLAWMLKTYPKSPAWEAWLDESGELPPDFDAMPSKPFLPDPLVFENGQPVKTAEQWRERREETLKLLQHYVMGTYPPPPGNVRVASETETEEHGARSKKIVLEFGPEHRAKLHLELLIPDGDGPFPVFLTQDNHRRWALIALSRGYIGCVYAGADSNDDTPGFIPVWPEYDWTKLTRRAWAGGRCIDYLYTLPYVDKDRIAITGHSRNGKLSLIASAIDKRINAVISSSSGAGGSDSYRFFSEIQFGEGIELITRNFPDWLHPRLRFFCGREDKLPIDEHQMVAMSAPRPFLFSTAINDDVESVWDIEHIYRSAKRVYRLLGAEDNIAIRYRPGTHATKAEDIEAYIDWLDTVFKRQPHGVTSKPIFPTYDDWLRLSGETVDPQQFEKHNGTDNLADDWESKRKSIRQHIAWSMGKAPSHADSPGGNYGSERNYIAMELSRTTRRDVTKESLNFGNYIAGDLYYPADTDKNTAKLPAIIWLHAMSNSNGYVAGYRVGERAHITLAREGYAVFAFDQIGNGNRINEITRFYERYPHWSILGKTVADVGQAVNALESFSFVDANRIYLVGYGLGATAGLHAAALNERIAGVVSVAGFTPMRNSSDVSSAFIVRRSKWFPFQPRLGAFENAGDRIPYDYDELIASIAPRPVLVVRPSVDYTSSKSDVLTSVESAQAVYQLQGHADALQFMEVDDYNHLSPKLQQDVYEKMNTMFGVK